MVEIIKGTTILNRYLIEKKLGSGGFGTVYLVEDIVENNKKALKKIFGDADQTEYVNEIKILLQFKENPYVISYYDHFVWEHSNVIVTEYYDNGDLGGLITDFKTKNKKLSDEKFDLWTIQMVKGLYYLHQKNIIHRDIKPQNIFITKLGDIVIGDLGLAKYDKTTHKTMAGTFYYASPEVILGKKYNLKTDMWSLGCVIYELKTYEILFYGEGEYLIMDQIVKKEILMPEIKNQNIAELLKKCLTRNIEERIDSQEGYRLLENGEDLKSNVKQIKKMFTETKKCIRVLEGHSDSVYSLTVLLTGALVSGSKDKTIRIWNPKTGKCLKILEGHSDWVLVLKVLSTGELISGSRDKTIRFWNAETGKCLKVLKEHSDNVYSLTVLSTGELVSGSRDKTIRIWNVVTGKCIMVLEGHSNSVYSLIILSNGELVSGSWDNTIRVWNTKTDKCLRVLEGHSSNVYSLTVLLTGELVSSSKDKTIRIWDAETGKCLKVLDEHTLGVASLTVLSHGKLASGSDDKTIRIWEADTRKCLHVLDGHSDWVSCLTELSTGELVSGSGDKTIRLWNVI